MPGAGDIAAAAGRAVLSSAAKASRTSAVDRSVVGVAESMLASFPVVRLGIVSASGATRMQTRPAWQGGPGFALAGDELLVAGVRGRLVGFGDAGHRVELLGELGGEVAQLLVGFADLADEGEGLALDAAGGEVGFDLVDPRGHVGGVVADVLGPGDGGFQAVDLGVEVAHAGDAFRCRKRFVERDDVVGRVVLGGRRAWPGGLWGGLL